MREVTKTGGDLDAARGFAERALKSNPLDERALFLLGLIAERQGNQARADAFIRLSDARTRRDPGPQAWLVNRDIQRGEFDWALAHADALLRVNWQFMEQLYPVLAGFMAGQRPLDALTKILASGPPWRPDALRRLSQSSDPRRLEQLFAALQASEQPLKPNELAPYLERLIRDGQFTQAHRSWWATLPAQQRSSQALLYNGDFTAQIDGLPFNWLLRPTNGVDIQVVASPGEPSGRALQLQFSGARAGVFTVGQLLPLPPGTYRLTGKVKAEGLRTERGLRWQVSCAESPPNTLGLTDLFAKATPWAGFSADFTVPAANCAGQWLNLEIPSRTASEREIDGRIWFENLGIANTGPGAPPPVH
ncbi:MAG: hypothetical protein WDN48_15495 [Pseudolabrys sp.]